MDVKTKALVAAALLGFGGAVWAHEEYEPCERSTWVEVGTTWVASEEIRLINWYADSDREFVIRTKGSYVSGNREWRMGAYDEDQVKDLLHRWRCQHEPAWEPALPGAGRDEGGAP